MIRFVLTAALILCSGVAFAQCPICPTPAACPNPKCECDPCTCGPDCACDGTGCACPGCANIDCDITVTVVDPAQQAYEFFNTLNEQKAMETLGLHNVVVQLGQRGLLGPEVQQKYVVAQTIMKKIADSGIGASLLAQSGDAEDKLRAAADLAGMLKMWAVPQKMFREMIESAHVPAPPKPPTSEA